VIPQTIYGFGYEVGRGSTKVDFEATKAAPGASAEAKVEAKKGSTTVEMSVKRLPLPASLGSGLLTYTVWTVSPDGRTINIGELQRDKSGNAQLKSTTELQAFSLFVTAEPYFAVRNPSDAVVLANIQSKGSKFRMYPIAAYPLLRKSRYENLSTRVGMSQDQNIPLELYEARNAVAIAKSQGAEKYAPEIYKKADGGIQLSEAALTRKRDKKEIISLARQTVQSAEDARELTERRQEEERVIMERQAAAAKAKSEAETKAAAEAAEAKRRTDEEARRQAELAAAKEAQLKAEASAAAAKAEAEADALRAKEEAAKAETERARKAAEQLRAQLLDSLNRVLETKDSPRGLVVTMADVLFDTGKYDLKPPTREKLARLSGIILANRGLNLDIEGHTDSTGADEVNQKLSEQRAGTARSFLVEQGLAEGAVTSMGLGKTMPVADNSTAAGRQQNRRVEIIVSGEVIGTKIGK